LLRRPDRSAGPRGATGHARRAPRIARDDEGLPAQPGDLVRLRLQSAADGAYHPVAFHFIGVVREFPTAPRDSFLIANAPYVAQATGSPAAQAILVRTSASGAVAGSIRGPLPPAPLGRAW